MSEEIQLAPQQLEALEKIEKWYNDPDADQRFLLYGYAGTGKSTLVKYALKKLKVRDYVTACFTGKAASVLRMNGNGNASTIHSLIYRLKKTVDESGKEVPTENLEWEINDESIAGSVDLIILDECSMVDVDMYNDIASFGTKILVIGDMGQLPPVGGQPAFANLQPDAQLTEIHRQALDSPIIKLATLARYGRDLPYGDYGNGVKVIPLKGNMKRYITESDVDQVICGTHKMRKLATKTIREALGYNDPSLFSGEKIVFLKNDVQLGIYNGTFAEVTTDAEEVPGMPTLMSISCNTDLGRKYKDIKLHSNHFVQHLNDAYPNPDWRIRGAYPADYGYVITCHKSQGSQWDKVVVIDESYVFKDDSRKWLYTAITRASEGLIILR